MRTTQFSGVFELIKKKKRILLTKNQVKGKRVYDEHLINEKGVEYREWDPTKSKLAAAILKNINQMPIKENDIVLYLGCASGTTASHVSDIIGGNGFVFALDFAPRVMRDMVFLCEDRQNIAPIMADANHPEQYADKITAVDVVYQDISQKSQAEIFLKNVDIFLKRNGYCLLVVKARSIDVTKQPKKIFNQVREKLEKHLKIVDSRDLSPYDKDHMVFVCRKR